MRKTLIVILLLVVLGLSGYSIYNANNPKEEKKESTSTNEELPKEDEPYKNETKINSNFTSNEEEKEVVIRYDQYITASGYAGASDNVYYTRNGSLYHLTVSSGDTIKLAEGVDKIESDLDSMKAYKGSDFKLIKEDDYVIYVDWKDVK